MNFLKNNSFLRNLIIGLIIASLCTGVYVSNILYGVDCMLADAMYQHEKTSIQDDIVLISIDQYSLDNMGNFAYWGRGKMGEVLSILNADPANAPAVVGIDILYAGESDDPEGDEYLAEMAGSGCPVVVACEAQYGDKITNDGNGEFTETNTLLGFVAPYDDLYYNTWTGHINNMYDADGIVRHGIWDIQIDEDNRMPSFAGQIYELYCQTKGLSQNTVPVTDKKGRYYVPFQAKPGRLCENYSIYDLLMGNIDPSVYAGKIVLIGPYANGMQDDFVTSVDRAAKMFGIEFQANSIRALIDGDTKREAGSVPQAIIIFLLVLGIWMLLCYSNPLVSAIVSVAGICVSVIACLIGYNAFDIVLNPLYVPIYVLICFLLHAAIDKKQIPVKRVAKLFKGKQNKIYNFVTGVIIAILCTVIYLSNILFSLDHLLSDTLYQHAKSLPGDIVLINIDQDALDYYGNFQYWGRHKMGEILSVLNADPDNAPAVIGIDVLYVGESDDPEGDEYLAEMAGSGCPVVVACSAVFGSQMDRGNGFDFHQETNSILAFDRPYDDLYYNAYIGHINSKFDTDGILRHGFWYIKLNDSDEVIEIPSFHRQIYELYCQSKGVEPDTEPVTDENGAYYVPYQGKPGDFSDNFSVTDLLMGQIDPANYAGKIVLIGPYAAGMQDDFTTAIDHATKMYGIEYQANMMQALINGETKREASMIPQAVAIFVIVLCMWVYLKNRKVMPSTIVSISVIAISLGVFITAYSKFNVVLSPLYIPLYIVICYVISVAVNYVRAALEKRRVTATFERYVAPEIVGELLKEGSDFTELKGRSCEIAVLFVDIRGFTSMSEVIPPEDVVEILDRYLTLTSSCIFKNKGTLDKFVGDCTMAFWGAPLPQDDIIFKAVKSAFDMVEGAADLKKELQEKYGRTVDFGVGVHYGPAVVGNIGSPNRMDFTAIGDTVNTASRLEANAPKGTIFVSRVVADALEGRVEFKSLGDTIKLKGKAEGFEVLEAVRILERGETV